MKNEIEKAKDRAAQIIAKAEAEQAVLDALPVTGVPVSVMIFRKAPHVRYKPESFADVLKIFDALETVPAFDCKDSGCRGIYAEPRGEVQLEAAAWVELSAGVQTGSAAKFRFYARLPGYDAPVNFSCEFGGSRYATQYESRPWHTDLDFRFHDMNPRAYKHKRIPRGRRTLSCPMPRSLWLEYRDAGRLQRSQSRVFHDSRLSPLCSGDDKPGTG